MFSTVAKTAFLTAALADYNPWHAALFDLNAELETVHPLIEAEIGEGTTCYDLVQKGAGTELKLNHLCMDVTDYKFQCAGEDAKPWTSEKKVEDKETTTDETAETAETTDETAETAEAAEEVADGERRLDEEGGENEEEGELAAESEGEFSEEEIKNRAVWKEEQKELEKAAEENVKIFGELLMCIEINRYYGMWRFSWLDESHKNMTCEEIITKWADGSCKSELAQSYGMNICCPGYCQTAEELGCKEHNVSDEVKDAIDQNQIGSKKLGEVCEEHKECAEALQCGSEARPTTPAPETTTTTTTVAPEKDSEETTTTTEEATAEEATAEEATAEEATAEEATANETSTDGEGRLLQEEENTEEEKEDTVEDNTEEENADTVEDNTEEENAETEKDNKDAEQEETTDEEKPTQKKCQKSGASYFGFGFIAALLAVVTL